MSNNISTKQMNQKGIAGLYFMFFFLVVAGMGVIMFLMVASIAPLQRQVISKLFPKKDSNASFSPPPIIRSINK